MIIKSIVEYIVSLIFPKRCESCGKLVDIGRASELCSSCADRFELEKETPCNICGKRSDLCLCESIEGEVPLVLMFYLSEGKRTSERLVFRLKDDPSSKACRFFARELSRLLIRAFSESGEDIREWSVTFPPRSTKNLELYGFDHGKKLAKAVSEFTGMSFVSLFGRTVSAVQKGLGYNERKTNAESSVFLLPDADVGGKKILVIDDIITTGATVRTAAELLRSAGASRVRTAAIFRSMTRNRRKPKTASLPESAPWFS